MNRDLKLTRAEFPEPERYELSEGPAYRFELSRREFAQVLGAGILISLADTSIHAQRAGAARSVAGVERLHIDTTGVVTVMTSKVEIGQGSRTQISQAAAEELRVAVGNVRVVMADSALVPDDGGTAGSRTTPSTIPTIRKACAAARELLLETAAREFGVESATLEVRAGSVQGPSAQGLFGYADLASRDDLQEALALRSRSEVTLQSVQQWTVLGSPTSKVGGREIVTGRHAYPSDIRRPGMLYAKILRPPAYGSKLLSIDLEAAQAMDGVIALRDGDFVGFAGPTSLRADDARLAASVTAQWSPTEQPSGDELIEYLRAHVASEGSRRGRSGGGPTGSVPDGLAASKTVLRASYPIAYIQHAPMEPRAAVAEWEGGKLTVWTGTQQPARVRGDLSAAFRLSPDKVRVIVPDTGGGFGGKHTGEVAVEAARLALAAKHPVSLRWTREEEFTWAYFRPAGVIDMVGGLSSDGAMLAWEQINLNSGGSAVATPYEVPNTRTQYQACESPLREGSYRALASTANVFARESFMDELAASVEVDPLAFRLRHLKHERLRAVLEAAVERFNWAGRRSRVKGSASQAVGLACGTEKGSYVATCVELSVDRNAGQFKVAEICVAFECGAVQNPLNLRKQIEGCILQGLGGALHEEIRFAEGRVLNPRFSDYRVPRFRDVPPIETILVDRPDLPSVGAGETPIVAVAPAIANALASATGVRIRSLPIRNRDFRSV